MLIRCEKCNVIKEDLIILKKNKRYICPSCYFEEQKMKIEKKILKQFKNKRK